MFCPKCGVQNADGTKFCRGCGSDVSGVPTALAARRPGDTGLAEKQIDLYGSGMRGAMIGVGFLITSGVAFAISTRSAVLVIFMLAFASYFFGSGVSKLLQARALRRLLSPPEPELPAASATALPDYKNPPASLYETDDLAQIPASVTDHTTAHLEIDRDER
jgi:hypothetical protein